MPIDRDQALKAAEKMLRQGKLDGAIAAYLRLVEDQPADWTSRNALGDLYLRSGAVDLAVEQFTLVADHLFADGVLPKAAALYKKALKAKSDHEHTIRQLAEIASRQGRLGDAKTYLRQLADLHRLRGDERGAAESILRLGSPEEVDAGARIAAARAAQALGDTRQASLLMRTAADDLEAQGRRPEALALLLSLARMQLESAEEHQARATLTRLLTIDPGRRGDVMAIALELARGGRHESAFGCIDVMTDAALLEGEWDRAVEGLQTFVQTVPSVPGLIKLVELCVDAGFDERLREAQAQLADAYLAEGRGAEASVIAEDLLHHDPASTENARRLARALELLGVADPAPAPRSAPTKNAPVEIDLSDALAGMDDPQPDARPATALATDADRIAALEEAAGVPQTRFTAAAALGRFYLAQGDAQAGIEWLERAAETSAPTPDESFAVVYELADALERMGEAPRALALMIELEAEAGEYRDVRARIEHIGRVQAGRRGR